MQSIILLLLLMAGASNPVWAQGSDANMISNADVHVADAVSTANQWDGPTTGPALAPGKHIIFVASDLRNGGVNAVAKGMLEAISHTDWTLSFLDGMGSELRQGSAIRKAIASKADGIVLGGLDATRHRDILQLAQQRNIPVVGWHAQDQAGSHADPNLFTNITTDPAMVAEIAAMLAISDTKGHVKTAIFTDTRYRIAALKARRMQHVLRQCKDCEVVAVRDIPLDDIADRMPDILEQLLQQHPDLSHLLVINDLYIDFAIPSLERRLELGLSIPQTISAGDGSRAAYQRIAENRFQRATVPEPLNMHGWQIIDEFNRAFHNQTASDYSAPVHLITRRNVQQLDERNAVYDPQNGYRNAYLEIWSQH